MSFEEFDFRQQQTEKILSRSKDICINILTQSLLSQCVSVECYNHPSQNKHLLFSSTDMFKLGPNEITAGSYLCQND